MTTTTTYIPSQPWVDESALKERAERLREVADKYRSPKPEQIQTLHKRTKTGYVDLRYTSHATVTQVLNEVDPLWQFEFVTKDGVPVTVEKNGMITAFCHLVLFGKRIFGVASCDADKADWAKELYGDGIRNCCMRAGIHIALWDKDFPEAEQKEKEAKQRGAKAQLDADLASVRKVAGKHDVAPKEPLAPLPDPLEEASKLVQEELGGTLATPSCGTQPERFAQWDAVPGCGKQVEEVDDRVVRITKTYLCSECLGKWRASTGAKEVEG